MRVSIEFIVAYLRSEHQSYLRNYRSDVKCIQWATNTGLICLASTKLKNKILLLICQTRQLVGQLHFGGIQRMFHCFKSCIFKGKGRLVPTSSPHERNGRGENSGRKLQGLYSQGEGSSHLPPQFLPGPHGTYVLLPFIIFFLFLL